MLFWGFYLDPLYVVLFIATLVISGGSQLYITNTFRTWSQVANRARPHGPGRSGSGWWRRLVRRGERGRDRHPLPGGARPAVGCLRSEDEDGRTCPRWSGARRASPRWPLPHTRSGMPSSTRKGPSPCARESFLVPALTFSPTLSYVCILFGLIFNLTGLFYLGIIFFALMVLFTLLTLPVRIDASRSSRGHAARRGPVRERGGGDRASRKVLTAAGLTYVAAAVTSILTLLYYLSLARRSS